MRSRMVLDRKEIRRWLLLAAALTGIVILLVIRVIMNQGSPKYLLMVWNLFLAWLPLLFALLAVHGRSRRRSGLGAFITLACGVLWLLFYPNAPYLITDLKHFRSLITRPGEVWPYDDLIMLFAASWTGVLLGALSLLLMHRYVRSRYGSTGGWAFTLLVLFLGAVGVYVGRFLRWNSWHVLTEPRTLWAELTHLFTYQAADFISLFTVLQLVTYSTVYVLMEKKS